MDDMDITPKYVVDQLQRALKDAAVEFTVRSTTVGQEDGSILYILHTVKYTSPPIEIQIYVNALCSCECILKMTYPTDMNSQWAFPLVTGMIDNEDRLKEFCTFCSAVAKEGNSVWGAIDAQTKNRYSYLSYLPKLRYLIEPFTDKQRKSIYGILDYMEHVKLNSQYFDRIANVVAVRFINVGGDSPSEGSPLKFLLYRGIVYMVRGLYVYRPKNIDPDITIASERDVERARLITDTLKGYTDEELAKLTDEEWDILIGIITI